MDLGGKLEIVERLGRLRDDGALTDAEFSEAKSKVLSAGSRGDPSYEDRYDVPSGYEPPKMPRWAIAAGTLAVVTLISWTLLRPDRDGTEVAPSTSVELKSAANPAEAERGPDSDPQTTAAALETEADALKAEGEAKEEALGIESQSVDNSAGPSVIATKAARCRVNVSDAQLTGPCTFKAFSDTEFEVSQPEKDFSAQVIRQGDEIHGILVGRNGSRQDLGPLTQKGACWNNSDAEICAWAI